MEGGLVKTLVPIVHAGILGERNNPEHIQYLEGLAGQFIDMVVVNLYPFEQVSESADTFEQARGNIDIGGPSMLRGAAKNFLGCAAVCDPRSYDAVLDHIRRNGGTTLDERFRLAQRVFDTTAAYDAAIVEHLHRFRGMDVRAELLPG